MSIEVFHFRLTRQKFVIVQPLNMLAVNFKLTFAILEEYVNFLFDSCRDANVVTTAVFCDNTWLSFYGCDAVNL